MKVRQLDLPLPADTETVLLPYRIALGELERLGRSVESITRRKDGWEAIVRHDCPPAHLLPIQTKPKNEHEKAT